MLSLCSLRVFSDLDSMSTPRHRYATRSNSASLLSLNLPKVNGLTPREVQDILDRNPRVVIEPCPEMASGLNRLSNSSRSVIDLSDEEINLDISQPTRASSRRPSRRMSKLCLIMTFGLAVVIICGSLEVYFLMSFPASPPSCPSPRPRVTTTTTAAPLTSSSTNSPSRDVIYLDVTGFTCRLVGFRYLCTSNDRPGCIIGHISSSPQPVVAVDPSVPWIIHDSQLRAAISESCTKDQVYVVV